MNQPKRKRRLFSFSLRALLIFMLLVACFFGWIGIRYRRGLEQRAILDKIKASGVTIYIDDVECNPSTRDLFFDGNYINRIDTVLCSSRSKIVDLIPLKNLRTLGLLYIKETDIAPLSELKNLKMLHVYLSGVDDKYIERLNKALPNCQIDYNSATSLDIYFNSVSPLDND